MKTYYELGDVASHLKMSKTGVLKLVETGKLPISGFTRRGVRLFDQKVVANLYARREAKRKADDERWLGPQS